MLIILLFFILCCVIFALFFRSRRSFNQPPAYIGAFPIIGHAYMFLGNSVQLWKLVKDIIKYCLQKGGVISIYIGPLTYYLVTDPDDCLTIANTSLDKHYLYDFGKPWIGKGLLTADVATWKRHRKLLNPAFNQQVLNGYMQVFNSQARQLTSDVAAEVGKGPFNFQRYLMLSNLETVCQTTLGLNYDEKGVINKEYAYSTEKLFNIFITRFQNFWLHSDYIFNWTSLGKIQGELIKTLTSITSQVIQNRKTEMENTRYYNEGKFKSFLDLILALRDQSAFTDEEIREQLDTIIVGAYDTSISCLTIALNIIGSRLDIQERAFEELQEHFEDDERDVDKYDLPRLIYVEAILKETLRLYPSTPIVARNTHVDVKLKNYTLPAGSGCFLCIYGAHIHPMWGPDAEEFKPERWLNSATIPDNPVAFAAFGFGKRSCIGKTYSMMSMKTTLAHILRRYRIMANISELELKIEGLLKTSSGHFISIERRY